MSALVDGYQVLKIKMCIDLRRTDIGMPQQLLHGTQITAGFQKMTGK
jgi:hypothetical protein